MINGSAAARRWQSIRMMYQSELFRQEFCQFRLIVDVNVAISHQSDWYIDLGF
jgi:hypothetical protein